MEICEKCQQPATVAYWTIPGEWHRVCDTHFEEADKIAESKKEQIAWISMEEEE